MIVIACVDDNMGLAFNGRRQSRDSAVIARIQALSAGGKLWMSPRSAKLFDGDVVPAEDFLLQAGEQEYAFTEFVVPDFSDLRVEGLVLYRWNRVYPADLWLEVALTDWKLVSTSVFSGTSHESITEEIYTR